MIDWDEAARSAGKGAKARVRVRAGQQTREAQSEREKPRASERSPERAREAQSEREKLGLQGGRKAGPLMRGDSGYGRGRSAAGGEGGVGGYWRRAAQAREHRCAQCAQWTVRLMREKFGA